MKKILRDILLVLALLLPLELWLNAEWNQLVGHDMREYLADLGRPAAGTRVVIFGDSHPHNAFLHTPLPDSVANVSFGSESLRDVHLKLLSLLRRGVRPTYVVVQADAHIFSPYRELTNNEQSVLPGTDVDDYNQVYGRTMSQLKKAGTSLYPLSDVQNRNLLITLLLTKYSRRAPSHTAAGQTWEQKSAEARGRVADARLLDQFGTGTFTLSTLMRSHWQQLLAVCRAKGIRVVAVRYPVADEYCARLPRYDLSAVAATLRALPPDTVLDYAALYAGQNALFQDSDHLSAAGSAQFGPRLLTDLARVAGRPIRRR
ncbi:MAG: hypothetical protein H7330_12920 [Hymenobacteraceae bacterium]|nr:hypothetical protein [Hymenobacteraceae bacterium]